MISSLIRCMYHAAWLARRQRSTKFPTCKLIKTDYSVEIVTRFCCDRPNPNRYRNDGFCNVASLRASSWFASSLIAFSFDIELLQWKVEIAVYCSKTSVFYSSILSFIRFFHLFASSFVHLAYTELKI
jgi:hypothetical protein